jgi:hypothetical protein
VTDDIAAYGLGALPDAPDERDYAISALYAAEGLTASVALPTTYAAPGNAAGPRPARHAYLRRLLVLRHEGLAGPA